MSKWKIVPVEATPEELQAMAKELPEHQDTYGAFVLVKAQRAAMLAAAPAWEPSDEDMKRAVATFAESEETTLTVEGLRTAILAAVRGKP